MYVNSQVIQTASVEGITEYKLKNGLKVLLFPDNSSQTITVNITYKVGSRHEGYGEKGMAHLLEHLVFKGTPNHPDIPKELRGFPLKLNTAWVLTFLDLVIDPLAESPSVINKVESNLFSLFMSFKCTLQSLNFLL